MQEWSMWSMCSKTCLDSTTSLAQKTRRRCEVNNIAKCLNDTMPCTEIKPCPLGLCKTVIFSCVLERYNFYTYIR